MTEDLHISYEPSAEQLKKFPGLIALQVIYENYARDCAKCDLHKTRTKVVFGTGNSETPDIAFLGEAPGAEEDESGFPFVGKSGKLVTKIMGAMGYERNEVYILNTVCCFPEDTTVEVPEKLRAAYRRYYEGELITVTTPGGQLTGTPNHPALTTRGVVALKDLKKSDYLVRCALRQNAVVPRNPHVDDTETRIEQVFSALAATGVGNRMPGRHKDFHGDGSDFEVDIVRAERGLSHWNSSSRDQHLFKLALELPRHALGKLQRAGARASAFVDLLFGLSLSLVSTPPGFGQLTTFFHGHSQQPDARGVTAPPDRNSLSLEVLAKTVLSDPKLLRERLEALASDVEFDQIIKVDRRIFAGHVYNLGTEPGWYVANGYVVGNCRPPENRNPEQDEIEACRPNMRSQLRAVRPKVIVCLGKVPAHALLGIRDSVGDMRRHWYEYEGIPVRVTYHPAFLLRDPSAKSRTWTDMQEVLKKLGKEAPK
jgi:uracil-DNA glycosylase